MSAILSNNTSIKAALIGLRSTWKGLAAICFLMLGGALPALAAQSADISVSQVGVPAIVGTPTNLTYIITVTNAGPGTVNAVADLTKPEITCPANITASADLHQCSKANVTFSPSATDNCPGVTTNCTPASGSTFNVGTTPVNCTATDASGNTANCSFSVT